MNSFKKFYTGQNYNQHMYNGLIGFFMNLVPNNFNIIIITTIYKNIPK